MPLIITDAERDRDGFRVRRRPRENVGPSPNVEENKKEELPEPQPEKQAEPKPYLYAPKAPMSYTRRQDFKAFDFSAFQNEHADSELSKVIH